jgi:hypothetical protein
MTRRFAQYGFVAGAFSLLLGTIIFVGRGQENAARRTPEMPTNTTRPAVASEPAIETEPSREAITLTQKDTGSLIEPHESISDSAQSQFEVIGFEFSVSGEPLARLDLDKLSATDAKALYSQIQRAGVRDVIQVAYEHRELWGQSLTAAEYATVREFDTGRFFVEGSIDGEAVYHDVTDAMTARLRELRAASVRLLSNPAWSASRRNLLLEHAGLAGSQVNVSTEQLGASLALYNIAGQQEIRLESNLIGYP